MKNDDTIIVKKGYKGHNKAVIGTLAMSLGLLVLFIFVSLVLMSRSTDEEIVNKIAGLAFYDLLICICGMVISAKALKEHTAHYPKALTGIILNTGVFILLVCMYFIGL